MKPNSYFWNIETIWEKNYFPSFTKNRYSFPYDKSFNYTPSENIVFTDEKDIEHKGLQKFSCIEKNSKAIFLVDNHHKVLTPFFQIFQQTHTPLTIVHIDAHRDDAKFQHYEKFKNEIKILQQFFSKNKKSKTQPDENICTIFAQLENACRVSDYLDLALRIDLIEEVIEYTQSREFQSFSIPEKPYILNLDIDIYGPEGTAIPTGMKTKGIAKLWNTSQAVCIATSPGFIDRREGEKIIDIFVGMNYCKTVS